MLINWRSKSLLLHSRSAGGVSSVATAALLQREKRLLWEYRTFKSPSASVVLVQDHERRARILGARLHDELHGLVMSALPGGANMIGGAAP